MVSRSTKKRTAYKVEPIRPDVLYPLREFVNHCGTGLGVLHGLHAKGLLRLKKRGNHYWVLGRDWIDYVITLDATPRQRSQPQSAPEEDGATREGVDDATEGRESSVVTSE